MVKTLSARQAQSGFETLLGLVRRGKNTVIVEERGKPMVAVIDFDRYQALVKKRFSVLDRVWARNRNIPARQAYRDATQAVADVRTARRSRKRPGA